MPRGVQVRPLLPAPEKGKSEQDFPFSGAAPVARDDPLRSNAIGASPPLSRSPHADLKAGSDLDRPSAPQRQKKAAPFRLPGLRKSIATREKRVTIKHCREDSNPQLPSSFPKRSSHWGAPFRLCGGRIRRSQLRSASGVTVSAPKAPHPLAPSSFPNREPHDGLPIRFI